MRCSFEGEIGAGSAPERSTSSSLRGVVELPLRVARAQRDLARGRRRSSLWMTGAVSTRLVEDDGEAALDVGARDALEDARRRDR